MDNETVLVLFVIISIFGVVWSIYTGFYFKSFLGFLGSMVSLLVAVGVTYLVSMHLTPMISGSYTGLKRDLTELIGKLFAPFTLIFGGLFISFMAVRSAYYKREQPCLYISDLIINFFASLISSIPLVLLVWFISNIIMIIILIIGTFIAFLCFLPGAWDINKNNSSND